MGSEWKNKLYYGDNLDIMREHIPDESVDLIYLDPPFNSKATYNVLFKEKNGTQAAAQITAFEDTWKWDEAAAKAFYELENSGTKNIVDLIHAMRKFLGDNDMMAYLVMMAIRLVEMHRVLKRSGSIYLHCDPTASHYIKLVLDAIFGATNYRSEIIWNRSRGFKRSTAKLFPHKHDTIFLYCKDLQNIKFNPQFRPHKPEYIKRFKKDEDGRLYRDDVNPTKGGRRIIYLDDVEGDLVESIWHDIYPLNPVAKERLGYPTQKPEALLERIINASSNEGDVVLDPFCGCGTTIVVAEMLNRRWIGIDITHLAITLMKKRLEDAFKDKKINDLKPYEVIGEPIGLSGAKALAEQDKYQFEWWALGKVGARPAQDKKKGADKGIDGFILFRDDESGVSKTIIISVKGGGVTVSQIRDLKGVIEREKAAIGVLLTLEKPTQPMRAEAASAGFYEPKLFPGQLYPKIQILTIEEILNGKQVEYPRVAPDVTFKKAERKSKADQDEQKSLF